MKFTREDLEIEGGRKLYLYHFTDEAELDRKQSMFWSAVSDEWREQPQVVEAWFAPVTQAMLSLLPSEGSRLLDLGCGAMTLPFPEGWDCVGVDISRPMLQPAMRTVVSSCTSLPFRDGSFPVVASRFALMFASDPARAFMEIGRALEPGGGLVFAVWGSSEENQWSTATQEVVLRKLGLASPKADEPHSWRLSGRDEVEAMLRSAGLEPKEPIAVTVPYLQELRPEDALEHLLAFAGPLRVAVNRLKGDEREETLSEMLRVAESVDRTGHAWVWSATKIPIDKPKVV